MCRKKNKQLVDSYLGRYNDTLEGYNQIKTWGLMKKLAPKNTLEPAAAKTDRHGNLITNRDSLEKLYLDTYKERLKPNEIAPELKELKELKEYLLKLQTALAQSKITKDWTLSDLEKVLKSLKNNKARDEFGHTFELFKYGGPSLKISLLNLFNSIKRNQVFPSILQKSNVTSFWKQKGKKSDLDNDRGVFNVSKVRSILDKLVYNDIYCTVDESMSCSNIGARKNRNIRDHLFVINAILNEVKNDKNIEAIDIQIYDVTKCFDKLEYTNTAIDLFKAGVQNDKFIVIANSNKNCDMAVKTPWGKTDRVNLSKIEMQGTVLAGLKCSVSIDTIGKESMQNEHNILYKYKNCTSIPPLSLIDDILCVSQCSPKSVESCATIKAKIETKQLTLSDKKCSHMHVGKPSQNCPELYVNNAHMKTVPYEGYLGDIISSDSKNDLNIADKHKKGIGYVNQIVSILKEISFGPYFFEQALQLRNAKLINGMLCSVEAIHGLTSAQVESLEKCDRMFMRKIFQAPLCTPVEAFYIETNALPIRFIIIARRLLFFWNIVNKPDSELIKQVYNAQKLKPVRNDWCLQIQQDLIDTEMNMCEGKNCIHKEKYLQNFSFKESL